MTLADKGALKPPGYDKDLALPRERVTGWSPPALIRLHLWMGTIPASFRLLPNDSRLYRTYRLSWTEELYSRDVVQILRANGVRDGTKFYSDVAPAEHGGWINNRHARYAQFILNHTLVAARGRELDRGTAT